MVAQSCGFLLGHCECEGMFLMAGLREDIQPRPVIRENLRNIRPPLSPKLSE